MRKEELQELFCVKISMEMDRFKKRMIKQRPEDVYNKSYQIDCTINIYEMLMEMSQKMEEEVLMWLLVFPNLLAFFYSRWMKTEDSYGEELFESISSSIVEISGLSVKEEDAA